MNYCLGTVQFGMDYGIQGGKQPGKEKVFEILEYAVKNGIRLFDTAPAYGDSETVIGDFLSSDPDYPEMIGVVSKLIKGAFLPGEEKEWGKKAVTQAENSIMRLGIRCFESFLFHDSSMIFDPQAVKALYEVKKSGLSKSIGVSVYEPEEALKALEYPEIGVIQIPYNVFDRRLDRCGFFDLAAKKKVRVFARSTFLQGLLLMKPEELPDRVSFAGDHLIKFRRICDDHSISPMKAAMGYVSGKKGIDYIVFGVDSYSQLQEYISLEDTVISDELRSELEEAFSDVEEAVVNPVKWK